MVTKIMFQNHFIYNKLSIFCKTSIKAPATWVKKIITFCPTNCVAIFQFYTSKRNADLIALSLECTGNRTKNSNLSMRQDIHCDMNLVNGNLNLYHLQ